jgi:tRNA(fMet)-specific endonuclease VapC
MRYLVDTNIWIYYLKTAGSAVEARLRRTPASDVAVCSIVWAELLHGARKYGKADERIAKIEQALAPYTSLPFDDVAAQHYADIRHGLETRGEIIGPYDLLIGQSHELIG